jgi:dipeptidyl aminopeptidase/acylaminoacyl peptidase
MNNYPAVSHQAVRTVGVVHKALVSLAVFYLSFTCARAVLYSPDLMAELQRHFTLPMIEDRSIRIRRGVFYSYSHRNDSHCTGDVYLPPLPDRSRLRPAIILIHGGSWREGSRDMEADNARFFAEHGFVAFNIDYRLVGQGGEYPNDVRDVEEAHFYLWRAVPQYHIDPSKIVLWGSSSGGHLAMMCAYAPGPFCQRTERFYAHRVANVAAVVSISGVSDLAAIYAHANPDRFVSEYLNGKVPESDRAAYASASPITFAANGIPTMLVHGTDDHNVPIQQSIGMARALQAHGIRSELLKVEGSGHWFGPVTQNLVRERVLKFLDGEFRQPYVRKETFAACPNPDTQK